MPSFDFRPPHLLTVRHHLAFELFGLLVFALGLGWLAFFLYYLLQNLMPTWWWSAPGWILSVVGGELFFDEERLVFDARRRALYFRRPFRKPRVYLFDRIERIECAELPTQILGGKPPKECRLVLDGGEFLSVYRGRIKDMDVLASKVAEVTGKPLVMGGAAPAKS
ncbi:MAG: hypothetical protein HS116_06815 [Planctomycetes bacterium]|nr:hypothetical protein [Planctomycetota bacterium]